MAWRGGTEGGGGPFCALGLRDVLHPRPGCGRPGRHPLQVAPGAGLRAVWVGREVREGRAQTMGARRARSGGASRLGEGGGAGGSAGGRAGLLGPAVHAAAPRVHEEIADGVELQAELLRDGDLHFLGRPFVLLKDGDQRASLQVGEHQALLLGLQGALLLLLLLLALAGCGPRAPAGGRAETAPPRGRVGGDRQHPKETAQRRGIGEAARWGHSRGAGPEETGDTEMPGG